MNILPHIPLEWMPPCMFAKGLVVFMIIGYPVALLAGRRRLLLRLPVDRLRLLHHCRFMQAHSRPRVRLDPVRTSCCSPSRSSPSWARSWRNAGWPRTCWKSMGQLFRARARRVGLFDHHRRLHPGRDHRHGGGAGESRMALITLPIMIRYKYDMRYADRRAGGLGHDHPAGAAVTGARGAGRPARPLRRRTCTSAPWGPSAPADRAVCDVTPSISGS